MFTVLIWRIGVRKRTEEERAEQSREREQRKRQAQRLAQIMSLRNTSTLASSLKPRQKEAEQTTTVRTEKREGQRGKKGGRGRKRQKQRERQQGVRTGRSMERGRERERKRKRERKVSSWQQSEGLLRNPSTMAESRYNSDRAIVLAQANTAV